MPTDEDIRAVTVPGCVDGWAALHERHGRLPLAVAAPQITSHRTRHTGVVVDGQLATTSLVDINVGLRILLGACVIQATLIAGLATLG